MQQPRVGRGRVGPLAVTMDSGIRRGRPTKAMTRCLDQSVAMSGPLVSGPVWSARSQQRTFVPLVEPDLRDSSSGPRFAGARLSFGIRCHAALNSVCCLIVWTTAHDQQNGSEERCASVAPVAYRCRLSPRSQRVPDRQTVHEHGRGARNHRRVSNDHLRKAATNRRRHPRWHGYPSLAADRSRMRDDQGSRPMAP